MPHNVAHTHAVGTVHTVKCILLCPECARSINPGRSAPPKCTNGKVCARKSETFYFGEHGADRIGWRANSGDVRATDRHERNIHILHTTTIGNSGDVCNFSKLWNSSRNHPFLYLYIFCSATTIVPRTSEYYIVPYIRWYRCLVGWRPFRNNILDISTLYVAWNVRALCVCELLIVWWGGLGAWRRGKPWLHYCAATQFINICGAEIVRATIRQFCLLIPVCVHPIAVRAPYTILLIFLGWWGSCPPFLSCLRTIFSGCHASPYATWISTAQSPRFSCLHDM